MAWSSVKLLLALSFLTSTTFAQTACSGQQYNDLPGFPASNSGCYPNTYYRTSDLGSTNPSDAMQRCQQQCTSDSQCSSVVAQVNKAADSNNYSGTCFFFASGSDPSGPRKCADTAYLLEGYKKDYTLKCFSSSSSSASKYCSSYLSIPVRTSTVTSTPPVVSSTTTVTTRLTSTTIVTTVTTPIVTATITTTVTSTVATTTTTTTNTGTTTVTSTMTATVTVTITPTATATPVKRAVAAATVPTPACVTSGTPATRLSAACKCLTVATSTTTTTTILPAVTSSITKTSTVPTTTTSTVTATAVPATISTTVTVTNGVTSTVTSTTTTTATITASATTTTTTTTTVTTAAPVVTACSNAANAYCSSHSGTDCKCFAHYSDGAPSCSSNDDAICNRDTAPICSVDSDCPQYNAYGGTYTKCAYYPERSYCFGDVVCIDVTRCAQSIPSSRRAKRDLERVFQAANWGMGHVKREPKVVITEKSGHKFIYNE